jgi:hypothetical protein
MIRPVYVHVQASEEDDKNPLKKNDVSFLLIKQHQTY